MSLSNLPLTMSSRWGAIYHAYGWTATLTADEPFAMLLLADVGGTTVWAKAPPSMTADLELRIEPLEEQIDFVRVSFSAPPQAYVTPIVTRLTQAMRMPDVPQKQFATAARLLRPVSISADPPVNFGLLIFAKSDIVVRRNHVWGLKPVFLHHFTSPFREVLEKGRTGSFETTAA